MYRLILTEKSWLDSIPPVFDFLKRTVGDRRGELFIYEMKLDKKGILLRVRTMKKTGWVKKIKNACIDAGTYQTYFDEPIKILADILEKRDGVEEEYKRLGAKPVIVYTNKGGKSNPVKNPLLVLWSELNKDALAYWRDLGLTPAGYKRINEKAATAKTASFEDLLSGLGA